MRVQSTGRKAFFEERGLGRDGTLVLVFVAMSGGEIGAVHGTIYGDFALGAATHGADFFILGRAKTVGLSFFTNRTRQKCSPMRAGGKDTVRFKKYKIEARLRHDHFVMKPARSDDQKDRADKAESQAVFP